MPRTGGIKTKTERSWILRNCDAENLFYCALHVPHPELRKFASILSTAHVLPVDLFITKLKIEAQMHFRLEINALSILIRVKLQNYGNLPWKFEFFCDLFIALEPLRRNKSDIEDKRWQEKQEKTRKITNRKLKVAEEMFDQ